MCFLLGIGRTSTFHELTAARQETIASLAGEPLATLAPRAPFIDGTFEACRCTLKRCAYRSSSPHLRVRTFWSNRLVMQLTLGDGEDLTWTISISNRLAVLRDNKRTGNDKTPDSEMVT